MRFTRRLRPSRNLLRCPPRPRPRSSPRSPPRPTAGQVCTTWPEPGSYAPRDHCGRKRRSSREQRRSSRRRLRPSRRSSCPARDVESAEDTGEGEEEEDEQLCPWVWEPPSASEQLWRQPSSSAPASPLPPPRCPKSQRSWLWQQASAMRRGKESRSAVDAGKERNRRTNSSGLLRLGGGRVSSGLLCREGVHVLKVVFVVADSDRLFM